MDLTVSKQARISGLGDAGRWSSGWRDLTSSIAPIWDPVGDAVQPAGEPSATAGSITGTRGSSRQVQLALRLAF
jgi:hypothetical protein